VFTRLRGQNLEVLVHGEVVDRARGGHAQQSGRDGDSGAEATKPCMRGGDQHEILPFSAAQMPPGHSPLDSRRYRGETQSGAVPLGAGLDVGHRHPHEAGEVTEFRAVHLVGHDLPSAYAGRVVPVTLSSTFAMTPRCTRLWTRPEDWLARR
jgi:hypothetical protein